MDYLFAAWQAYLDNEKIVNTSLAASPGVIAFVKASPGTQKFLLWFLHYPVALFWLAVWMVSIGWLGHKPAPMDESVAVILENIETATIQKGSLDLYYDNVRINDCKASVKDDDGAWVDLKLTWAEQRAVRAAYRSRIKEIEDQAEADAKLAAAMKCKLKRAKV